MDMLLMIIYLTDLTDAQDSDHLSLHWQPHKLTIALETFKTKSTRSIYHLLPYNLYFWDNSLDLDSPRIASSCDKLLV